MTTLEIIALVLLGIFAVGGIYLIMVSDKIINKKDDDIKTNKK